MEHKTIRPLTCCIFVIALVLSGCSGVKKSREASTAFYYWRTTFVLTPAQREYLGSLHITKLYVKFFDVDWNPRVRSAVPVAPIEFKDPPPHGIALIPTVFITNRTLQHLTQKAVKELAGNIVTRVKGAISYYRLPDIRELQIDCDWSRSTKDTYFHLLQSLKDSLRGESVRLSSTIRLHQITYKATMGIPPVDRGVLMFYNMGDIDKPETKNSILDVGIGRYYLDRSSGYPIPLDVALPLFRWGVLIRNAKVVDLIHGMSDTDLADAASFQPVEKSLYKVTRSRYICSRYVYKDDMIRLEEPSFDQLRQAAEMLRDHLASDTLAVVFYHFDTNTPERYRHEDLRDLLALLRR